MLLAFLEILRGISLTMKVSGFTRKEQKRILPLDQTSSVTGDELNCNFSRSKRVNIDRWVKRELVSNLDRPTDSIHR